MADALISVAILLIWWGGIAQAVTCRKEPSWVVLIWPAFVGMALAKWAFEKYDALPPGDKDRAP